jgi:hypothetical protein
MKIRNVKTSLLVLVGLIILSLTFYVSAQENSSSNNNIFLDSDQDGLSDAEEKALGTDPKNKDTDGDGYSDGVEVKTGYDPLKPAPGDKLINEAAKKDALVVTTPIDEKNLTQVLSQKIIELSKENGGQGDTISQDDVQTLVDEARLANANQEIILPEISPADLKIKKQDYQKYSKEKAAAKRKEDFSNYITAVFYIMSSNSPQPVTSNTNLSNVFDSLSQEIIQALTLRNTASLGKLNASGEKIREQLMDVEVPEELVDTHIKIMQFANYSQEAEKLIDPVTEDPIADITNLSQLAGLVNSSMSFMDELALKFNTYELTNTDAKDLQKKIEGLGIEIPKDLQTELEKSQAIME